MNAAIAVARLGGTACLRGSARRIPATAISNQLIDRDDPRGHRHASAWCGSPSATAPVSGIMVDGAGERMIATYRDKRIESARIADPDRLVAGMSLLLADNRFPHFVRPICEAARRRGIPVVLDADRPTVEDDPLFVIPTHVVFSSRMPARHHGPGRSRGGPAADGGAHQCVPGGQRRARARCATSPAARSRTMPVFKVEAVDTLAAGDVFHAGMALALAEGRDEIAAMRFGAAAAALKCTRFGGSMGAPTRAEVEALLAQDAGAKRLFFLRRGARRAAGRAGAGEILRRHRTAARRRGQMIRQHRGDTEQKHDGIDQPHRAHSRDRPNSGRA